jgi:hypothetical protein
MLVGGGDTLAGSSAGRWTQREREMSRWMEQLRR